MYQINPTLEDVEKMAEQLQKSVGHVHPTVGIICGTGLGGLADLIQNARSIDYANIPGFPVSTVEGHRGRLVFGDLGSVPVVCMQGRFHMYEGYEAWQCALPVRLMKVLGIHTLIVTNAAGSLNPSFKVGDFMLMKDHINLPGMTGFNPLRGPNDPRWGPRFPPMNQAYDRDLWTLARRTAAELDLQLQEGVYVMVVGPNYETVAEVNLLRLLGADAVGMSTVPEVLVAKHCGLKVLGFSLITNIAVSNYTSEDEANHEEVLETGELRKSDMEKLITRLVVELHKTPAEA